MILLKWQRDEDIGMKKNFYNYTKSWNERTYKSANHSTASYLAEWTFNNRYTKVTKIV